ncbi:transmembrane protein 87A isoform X2 [Arctopsyche grandis]|uniref:transmembrane protein 87A isoform X2 n=1 Tax=Arctopsyche grandis TaxID=121162 RepID=UPI00406D992A
MGWMSWRWRWPAAPLLVACAFLLSPATAASDQGRWDLTFTQSQKLINIPKSMYKGSQIFINVICNTKDDINISLQWTLYKSQCWKTFYRQCDFYMEKTSADYNRTKIEDRAIRDEHCYEGFHIDLTKNPQPAIADTTSNLSLNNVGAGDTSTRTKTGVEPVFTVKNDAVYLLSLNIEPDDKTRDFNVSVTIKMRGTYGYLSAVDWPFLPFYASMCGVYVGLGTAWLIVCWLQWRDLLRIQFWIGAVILLGMLEKATFYAEYSSINSSGISVKGVVLIAEWVSVIKRALARMLVVIVSLGFGIVKPRLGPMLQRVVGLGVLWGGFAALEAWLRISNRGQISNTTEDTGANSGNALLAGAPLAVLDAALCWWVFASLLHTTRTLRLRRNMVKLSLYKHFTNTLTFAVLSSIFFMLYTIKAHCLADCLKNWKELWVHEAYWHVLFSVVLLVIMILWRPTNNNQRYAFTPLLDNADDDDEEEHFVSDAYGVKIRGFNRSSGGSGSSPLLGGNSSNSNSSPPLTPAQQEEADLRWVEDNIPATALPILDSDEEILNAKFEVSKMQ